MNSQSEPEKKIIVDTDWKEQVRKEKQQQAAEESQAEEATSGSTANREAASAQPAGGLPKPDFMMLISMLATQAFAALGQIPDPQTGQAIHQPELAKHMIDLLAVVEEKTKGNLTPQEDQALENLLHELRMAYVALTQK